MTDRIAKAKIILLCCLAAAMYGIAHDEITIGVSAEYFTIAHPRLFPTTNRILLALCWGIAGTVWLGAAFGFVLASVSNSSGRAPIALTRLSLLAARLLCVMAVSALAAGVAGFQLSLHSLVSVPAAVADAIPSAAHDRFMAVWFAHIASYLAAFVGGAVLIYRLWQERGRPRAIVLFPRTKLGALRAGILAAIAVVTIWFRWANS